jgi:hypothetical protein
VEANCVRSSSWRPLVALREEDRAADPAAVAKNETTEHRLVLLGVALWLARQRTKEPVGHDEVQQPDTIPQIKRHMTAVCKTAALSVSDCWSTPSRTVPLPAWLRTVHWNG